MAPSLTAAVGVKRCMKCQNRAELGLIDAGFLLIARCHERTGQSRWDV